MIDDVVGTRNRLTAIYYITKKAVGFGQTMAAVMWNTYDLNKFGCSFGGSVFLFAHNSIPLLVYDGYRFV